MHAHAAQVPAAVPFLTLDVAPARLLRIQSTCRLYCRTPPLFRPDPAPAFQSVPQCFPNHCPFDFPKPAEPWRAALGCSACCCAPRSAVHVPACCWMPVCVDGGSCCIHITPFPSFLHSICVYFSRHYPNFITRESFVAARRLPDGARPSSLPLVFFLPLERSLCTVPQALMHGQTKVGEQRWGCRRSRVPAAAAGSQSQYALCCAVRHSA